VTVVATPEMFVWLAKVVAPPLIVVVVVPCTLGGGVGVKLPLALAATSEAEAAVSVLSTVYPGLLKAMESKDMVKSSGERFRMPTST